jgi:hypothetical protein
MSVMPVPFSDSFHVARIPSGHEVRINGGVVPHLQAFDRGEVIEFVLDERFSYPVPREWAGIFASAIAQALNLEAADRTFAPNA